MPSTYLRTILFPAALAAAALLALPAAAEGPELSPIDVAGRAPTTVHISLAGKTAAVVRTEIGAAARLVCRNAVRNTELDTSDLSWCRNAASKRANRTYAVLARTGQLAAGEASIQLSAR